MMKMDHPLMNVLRYFVLYFLIGLYATPWLVCLLAFLVGNFLLGYDISLATIMESDILMDVSTVLGSILVIFLFIRKGYAYLGDRTESSSTRPFISIRRHGSVVFWSLLLELAAILPINYLVACLQLSDYTMAVTPEGTVSFIGLLGICLLAPIAEELVMRGGIEEQLLRWKNNPVIAILLSAFLFAVLHMSPSLIIGTFLSGLIAGWVYYRTRNVLVCIFMHMSNNIASCLVDWLQPDLYVSSDSMAVKLVLFFSVGLVVAALYFLQRKTA